MTNHRLFPVSNKFSYRRTASFIFALLPLAVSSPIAQAQSRAAGDPLQRLPDVQAPPKPSVQVTVDTTNRLGMESLLAKTIVPSTIRIEGVKSIPFDQVSKHFSAFVGKPTTVKMLIDAASQVTQLYQDQGYALSFAFIPAQDFAGGVVRVVAVEGYVSSVTIDGEVGNAEKKIRQFAQHMVNEHPLRRNTFERYIALLGQLPGLKIAANVAPPKNTDGATELNLKVSRQKFGGSAGVSFNQPGIQGLFTVTENGLLSLGEQLSVSALAPRGRDGQTYYSGTYTQPIGSDGLTVSAQATHYKGEPRNTIGLPDNIKRSVKQDKEGLTLSYPIILTNTRKLNVSGSAYAVSNEDRYTNQDTGANLGLRSQARVIQSEVSWAQVDEKTTRQASIVVAKGLDILGASKEGFTNIANTTIPNNVDLSFFRIGGSVAQTNTLPYGFGTAVALTGQYSGQSLPTSEEIIFGAQRFALGYEPGETSGDSGWGASIELNRGFSLNQKYLKTLIPYISYAVARTYLNASSAPPVRLASVAMGIRISDSRFYSLDLSVGQPVGDKPIESNSRSPRVNASLTYKLD